MPNAQNGNITLFFFSFPLLSPPLSFSLYLSVYGIVQRDNVAFVRLSILERNQSYFFFFSRPTMASIIMKLTIADVCCVPDLCQWRLTSFVDSWT